MSRRPSRSDLEAVITSLRTELRHIRHEHDRLCAENEILRDAATPSIHHAPAHERFTFINTHRNKISLKALRRILLTDRAHYRAWAKAATTRAAREAQEQQLIRMIVEIHTAYPAYGAERITRELKRQGISAGQRADCGARLEIRPSTSRAGSGLDGAAAESFFATLKTEIGTRSWPDRTSAHRDIENWITNYNQWRLHSTLDYQTPTATRLAWQERITAAL